MPKGPAMVDDEARRAHALFVEALGMEAVARDEFLRSACPPDSPLRKRVEQLLAAAATPTDFLETPALQSVAPGPALVPGCPPSSVSVRGYRVVRMIAAGGMAVVYEAMQEQPSRRVALKVMNRALTHTSAVRRFRFETEVLARLRHPGVAQIFDAGTCDAGQGHPVPFFAMEYVEAARTLIDYAQCECLPLRDRLVKFAEVCDAVQHGHQHGVIHRDLKPGNILVGSDGRVKVIDFGVARSVDAEQGGLTRQVDVGKLIGTLNYMSPEQCTALAAVDIRADVYSLGVILYQLVTGRTPFDLNSVPLLNAVRIITYDPPRRPGSLAPACRGDLEAIIGAAMEKEPARRYPSAGALADDLRRYLNHQPVTARPPTVVHHACLFAWRHRTFAIATLIVAGILVAAGVVTAVSAVRLAREADARRRAEGRALVERDAARRISYIASVGGAMASAQNNDYAQARSRLTQAPVELRNWEWSFVSAIVEQGEEVIPAHGDMVLSLAMSQDGRRLASGSRDGGIGIWDSASRTPLHRFDGLVDAQVNSVAFTRDGRRIVAGAADHTIHVLDTESGRPVVVFRGHTAGVECVACGPQDVVASASASGTLRLWKAESGEEIRSLSDQPGGIRGVAFSPDGTKMITWNRANSVWVRAADASAVYLRLSFEGKAECAVVSPDGQTLAVGGSDGRVTLYQTETGAIRREFTTAPSISTVRSLAFSRDGQWILAGQIDRTITIWHVDSGAVRSRLLGHSEAVSGLAVSPEGDRVFSASWDRTIRVWPMDEPEDHSPIRTLNGHSNHVLTTAVSPDGSLFASGGLDRTVCLWDRQRGSLLATLPAQPGAVHSVAFAPNGERLASAGSDGCIRVWSTRTGACESTIDPKVGPLWTVAFSPAQPHLASAGDDRVVRVWSTADQHLVQSLSGHESRVTCVAFSPDGSTLASVSQEGTIRLWDVASGRQLLRMAGHTLYVYTLVFSPDGRFLYSGSRDQTVRIWNTQSGQCLDVLSSQGHLVSSLTVSPDGNRLAAGSWFGEVIIWDTTTHELVFSFKGQNNAIRSIAFSPDGRSLLCGGHDIALKLFDAIPRVERAAGREEARKLLGAAERVVDRVSAGRPHGPGLARELQNAPGIDPRLLQSVWKVLLRRCVQEAAAGAESPRPGTPVP